MGQEISASRFRRQDFEQFGTRLAEETALLETWFREACFDTTGCVAGFELEAWLVSADGRPAAMNAEYLDALGSPLVVPELSVYNVEINTRQRSLEGAALGRMRDSLDAIWARCNEVAARFGSRLAMIGTLPSLREEDLGLHSMSPLQRYRALNEQVLRLRQGRPLELEVRGAELLRIRQPDVMLEAATTSFQLHLQTPEASAARLFNASVVAAAPTVAVAANSPFLFGRELWQETRVPVFEQAVAVGGDEAGGGPNPRVTFGSGYVRESLFELFAENRDCYPVLLPMCESEPLGRLYHLRLHNGTIWRWIRPLIGFDGDGTPHLRIEHRVIPAGPSVPDAIANAAFYYGLAQALAAAPEPPEARIDFQTARENFYAAARYGLAAQVRWLDGREAPLRALVLETLLPLARKGLQRLDIEPGDTDECLDIIEARTRTGRTGAQWQLDYVARHGRDMEALTLAYLEHQQQGLPVHEWGVLC
jgi:gamma-glutamyl:cysteine ligase YbdK (ATP-grasp superfamily)